MLPEEPLLDAPTVADLQRAVDGTSISGDQELLNREVMDVLVAGMTAEHVLERLTEGVAVITPGDRSDVVLAVVSAHAAEGFPSLSCIILNGGLELHPSIAALVSGLGLRLPIIATTLGTFETASAVAATRGRVTATSQRKIDTALALMDTYVDTADLLAQLAIPIPTVVTPQMFTYQLLDRARADRKRIVLPEGRRRPHPQGGRAAAAAQRRRADHPRRGGRRSGPAPPNSASTCPKQRCSTREPASCAISSPSSTPNCASTRASPSSRPARPSTTSRISARCWCTTGWSTAWCRARRTPPRTPFGRRSRSSRRQPGVTTVSSIFLMCLADRVLAYGDCAIVPDPTSEQLADIAISSARTAAQFGIEPRVAMLSYSTGTSGTGADVDKVRAATELVRERQPDLLVEGPIQYDAAVEPTSAAAKMPDSKVAGRATVLIFPDLNTGNNTYKAVQRSAGADRDRPGAAGAEQAGQRPVPRRAGRGHRQHRRDHRDPGAGHVMATRTVLVLNSGSSSLKYAVVEPDSGAMVADGIVERIGDGPVADHGAALRAAFDRAGCIGATAGISGLVAVGHRVVHGGPDLYGPTLIDDALVAKLEELVAAGAAAQSARRARVSRWRARRCPTCRTSPCSTPRSSTTCRPRRRPTRSTGRSRAQWHIRRYGFHGTSHQYVSEQAAAFLGVPLESLNQIVLHLGNGASASAIVGGRPVDTSMGLTPMEGLVMGTRSGDIDPGVVMYLSRTAGMSVEDIETMLNRRSGVLGLGGEIDFRVLHQQIESGDAAAQLAYDVYIHRLRKYIGAYLALLGNTDVITFTAGVGENDAAVRRDALAGMTALGIELDEQLNASPARMRAGSRQRPRRRRCWWSPRTRSSRSHAAASKSSRNDCGSSSGRKRSGSQIPSRRRTCRPARTAHVRSYRVQIILTLCRAAKPAVPKKSTSRRSITKCADPAIWPST